MIKPPFGDGLGPMPAGVTALLLSRDRALTACALDAVGARVIPCDRLDGALGCIAQLCAGVSLVVCDCDSFGGTEVGHDLCRDLRKAGCDVPVILLSAECPEQIFPPLRGTPFLLRAPLTVVSLRISLQLALSRVESAAG